MSFNPSPRGLPQASESLDAFAVRAMSFPFISSNAL